MAGSIPRFFGDNPPGDGQVTTAKLANSAVTNAKVAANAAIAGSKLQALSVGGNAGVIPSTGVANAHVAADAAIAATKLQELSMGVNGGVLPSTGVADAHVAAAAAIKGSKLAAEARIHHALSTPISLTNAGPATVSRPVLRTSVPITVTAVHLIYDVASDAGSVPNVELGVNGALADIVAPVAAEGEKELWTATELIIADGSVAADKIIVFSTVAGAQTTNTGEVRVAIEYTIDDAA